jgi:catechol 2,3-dioxygenase-like lactoylglutathione lyase family enzyme
MEGALGIMRIHIVAWGALAFAICAPAAPIALAQSSGAEALAQSPLRNMLVINEDDSHFFGTRKPEDMTLAGLHAFIDQYANSAVTHLFLCPNAMRASFRSSTRDAIWDPVEGVEPLDIWPQNGKRLLTAGLDPYAVWISRCREKHISPWLSMRMNDVHSVDDPSHFLHSTFWREHPEYWRVPHGSAAPWVNRALNYTHAAVREHQMSFVRELLERYDADGLELDWMRFGYHLTPGREQGEGTILTEFVRAVRALTKEWSTKRGHPIPLAVRVPAHPDAASGLGMDAVAWARDGLVDLIVPCPFWTSSDFDIPVELWRERLGSLADQVTVAPGLEYNARPWPGAAAVANDLACARGFAASAYSRGADSVYLFNWMDSETRPVELSDYQVLLRDGLSPQAVSRTMRRHPVCFRDTVPAGFPSGIQLPIDAQAGGSFQIHIGPKPVSADVWAIAGLSAPDTAGDVSWEVSLNNQPLGLAESFAAIQELGGGAVCAIRFACPLGAVAEGYNKLSIRRVAGSVPQQIVWVELRVVPRDCQVHPPT